MATIITSTEQIASIVRNALDETAKDLLDELLRIIEEEVYSYQVGGTDGSGWNNRTREFENSWSKTDTELRGLIAETEILQNIGSFSYKWNKNDGEWSHGNAWEEFPIEDLDVVINEGLKSSNFGFPAIQDRPYWGKFKEYVKNNLSSIFESHLGNINSSVTINYNF
jgi:hypothetical protein